LTALATVFLAINVVALLSVPRRWAFLPLILAACYMTQGQGIEIGAFSFTVIRFLVAAGLIRVILRQERLPGGFIGLDRLILLWAVCACISSRFHTNPTNDLVYKLGYSYDVCGFYFLVRFFCTSREDVTRFTRTLVIVLIPVALAMINEQMTGRNLYSFLGGVPEMSMVRDGRIRSMGPFRHPVLAGTVAAVTLPFIIGLRQQLGKISWIGGITCMSMILTSASSGPVMSAVAAAGALSLWPLRERTRALRWGFVIGYIILDFVMQDPAYYLIARIDITGSSTGYHRARLIQSSFAHLDEWWLGGTDYTRHWMPSGVSWSPDHSDITNQYIKMGVIGGLPLMFLFIGLLVITFRYVGKGMRRLPRSDLKERFLLWTLGSAMFTHAVTFLSVHYFDQSSLFIYLTMATIASLVHNQGPTSAPASPLPASRFYGQTADSYTKSLQTTEQTVS
jgi:hypothetical protein